MTSLAPEWDGLVDLFKTQPLVTLPVKFLQLLPECQRAWGRRASHVEERRCLSLSSCSFFFFCQVHPIADRRQYSCVCCVIVWLYG